MRWSRQFLWSSLKFWAQSDKNCGFFVNSTFLAFSEKNFNLKFDPLIAVPSQRDRCQKLGNKKRVHIKKIAAKLIQGFMPKIAKNHFLKISENNQLTRPNLGFFKNLWQQLSGAKISSKSDFVYSIFSAFEFSQFLSPKMLKWDRELLGPQFWWVTFTFGPK